MKTLISMVEFVKLIRNNKNKDNIRSFWACEKYAKFLSQKLELWMFVPCDSLGRVIESIGAEEYKKAKERVLFEGFESKKGCINYNEDWMRIDEEFIEGKTIENLIPFNLTLTPTAQKMIGL